MRYFSIANEKMSVGRPVRGLVSGHFFLYFDHFCLKMISHSKKYYFHKNQLIYCSKSKTLKQ